MKKEEEGEFTYLVDEDTDTRYKLAKVNSNKNYMFCPQCKHIRGSAFSPTFLTHWESVYFNSWGMCKQCFDYINSHREKFEEFSGNIEVVNGKVKKVENSP